MRTTNRSLVERMRVEQDRWVREDPRTTKNEFRQLSFRLDWRLVSLWKLLRKFWTVTDLWLSLRNRWHQGKLA